MNAATTKREDGDLFGSDYARDLPLGKVARLLYFSAGADLQLLRYCPHYDRVKLQGIGGTVVATAILAFVSSFFAFFTVFVEASTADAGALSSTAKTWLCAFSAAIWAAIIYNLDRFIVSSTGHGDGTDKITWGELFYATPRLLMAVAIGFVISKPLEIRIMKSEIDAKLGIARQAEATSYIAVAEKERADAVEKINKSIQELTSDRDKKSEEKNSFQLKKDKATADLALELNGKANSGVKGPGPLSEKKEKLLSEADRELSGAISRLEPEIKELESKIASKYDQRDAVERKYESDLKQAKLKGDQVDGLMKRIELAHEIAPVAAWFLTALLVFVEVSPLIFKMMIALSPIDYLTENQKRLTVISRGIHISYDIMGDESAIHDVKNARYLEVEYNTVAIVDKIEAEANLLRTQLELAAKAKMDEITGDPSHPVDRVKPIPSNKPGDDTDSPGTPA